MLFTGDIWEGYGPGPFSMAGGVTYREQWFWQRGYPQRLEAYGPPLNARRRTSDRHSRLPRRFHDGQREPARVLDGADDQRRLRRLGGVHGVQPAALGSRLRQRSGSRSTSPRATPTTRRAAASTRGRPASTSRSRSSCACARTVSRDVREPTFAERFDLQGGGGSITVNATTIPTGDCTGRPFQITVTSDRQSRARARGSRHVTAGFVVSRSGPACSSRSTGTTSSSRRRSVSSACRSIVNECAQCGHSPLRLRVPRPRTNTVTAVLQPVPEHQRRARTRHRLRAVVEHGPELVRRTSSKR